MTEQDAKTARALVALIFLAIVGIGLHLGLRELALQTLQQEAIEHGHAEYDSETGEWQWKDEEPE